MERQWAFDTAPIIGKIRELGMSQEEFAKQDGRSSTAVRNILSGKTDMTLKTIMKWTDILNLNVGSPEWQRVFFSTKKLTE